MPLVHKLKTLLILWSLVIIGTAVVSISTLVHNSYIASGLVFCAVSNYLADVQWNSLLFALVSGYVVLATTVLRLIVHDGVRRLSIALRSCLCLFFLYLVLIYINSRVWFPEPYSVKGVVYNLLMLLVIFGISIYLPFPSKSASSLLSKIKMFVPVSIIVLLYVFPGIYNVHYRNNQNYNVIFITVDTLRYGNLSMNGYGRHTSGNIDDFAEQCLVFNRAFAQSSFTPPSHASMFTSRIVSNHKLYSWNKLDDRAVTMAEIFANEGFKTAAFTNMSLLSEQNLGQGFQTKVESFFNLSNCLSERIMYNLDTEYNNFFTGHEINEMFLKWLKSDRGDPFFVWLHYWDVHRPFAQDEQYELLYSDQNFSSRKIGRNLSHYNLREKNIKSLGFTDADLRYLKDRYDAGIYTFDLMFRDLLASLKEIGVFDNSIIVLTADHGESLMEREEMFFAHDPYLYNEVINVPLIIKLPGEHKKVEFDEPVMLIDLLPTLMKYLNIEDRYRINTDGRALDLADNADVIEDNRNIVSECFGWRKKRSVVIDNVKYIYDFEKDEYEVYDLSSDSAEKHNLDHSSLSVTIENIMNSYNNDLTGAVKQKEIDAEQYERLKALGYIDQ